MDRASFIKSVLAGAAAVGLSAVEVKAEKEKFLETHKDERLDDLGIAIDLDAISNIHVNGPAGKGMRAKEIIDLYFQTGILIYRTPYHAHGTAYSPIQVIPRVKKLNGKVQTQKP